MESDDEMLEMLHLLQDQSDNLYEQLLHLLQSRHLAAFKSMVHRALSKEPPRIDVNHLIGHPTSMTFLDKAATENLPEFVEFLLDVGANPNNVNPERNRAPIHFAAEAGNSAALKALLKDPNIRPNLKAAELTALHYAVKAPSEECATLLLEAGTSPNIPNNRGMTALHMAADKSDRSMVQLIIENFKPLILDTYKDRKKETARMVINKKFPDIVLPKPTESKDYASILRYYLTANDEENFRKTLDEVKNLDNLSNKSELLRMTVERNLHDALTDLLKQGALDPVSIFELGKLAVERAHPEILKDLLSKNSKLADRLLLSACQELGIPSRPGPGHRNNRIECLKMILSQDGIYVRQVDEKGNTPLHYAARAESQEAVEILLKRGSYMGFMNNFGIPPLAHILPSILKSHMDDCLSSAKERTEDYEIIVDYYNLVPHDTKCSDEDNVFDQRRRRSSARRPLNPCSETEALLYIANHKTLRPLLKHPLLASFLHLKFLRIRPLLYLNFLLYLMFYVLLLLFIRKTTTEDSAQAANETMKSPLTEIKEDGKENGTTVLYSFLTVGVCYLLIRELTQFISSPLHYLISLENWIEVALIGLTIGLLIGAGAEVAALAILLSTWELVLLISQHPVMSTKIEMFKTVTINIIKYFFLYIFPVFAFAMAFSVLFKGNDNFPNAPTSLFKTIIMLTGELDSGDLPFFNYPLLSHVIFIGFIMLIVISLLNLLTGLAVNDTAQILAEARLVCLKSQAQLVAYAERISVGSPFIPHSQLCCFINQMPFQSLTTFPLRFMARRVLLFPHYLPRAKLSIKPLKNHLIKLHGKPSSTAKDKWTVLTMDPEIVHDAKEILRKKSRQSSEDKIVAQLNELSKRFDGLQEMLQQISVVVHGNNENTTNENSGL